MCVSIFLFIINEHNSRRKHKRGTTLNYYITSDYDHNYRYNSYLKFNSENITQSFGNNEHTPNKKIRGNTLIADISINGFKYNDLSGKSLRGHNIKTSLESTKNLSDGGRN